MFSNKTLVKTNLTDPGRGNAVAATVAKCLVFFITITATLVGNSLIFAAMKQFRGLRTPTNIVLCSLATTDLGMVIVMVLHAITDVSGHWISSRTLCDFVATLGLVLAFISILHLCFLSIDRYVAIKSPLRYLILVTRRRVLIVLVLLWLLPSISLNLPAADYRFRSEVYGCPSSNTNSTELRISPYIFIFVAFFVAIPFSIMLFTNSAVFRVALSHVKRMSTIERQLYQTSESEPPSCHEKTPPRRPNNNTLMLKREIKSAKTFALVIGVFLVCYTPFFVTGTYRKVVGREGVSDLVMFITTWLAFANSFSNPLVYSLRYSPFKKAFKKLCCVQVLRITNEKFSVFQASKTGRMQERADDDDVVKATSLTLKKEEKIENKQSYVSNGQGDDKKEQKAMQSQILHKDDSNKLNDSSL